MEFFDAVARLKPDPVELSYTLDQGGQMRVHQWLCPLSLDNRREHKLILPWRLDMHIDQKPLLLRMFLATLEEHQDILILMVMVQRQSDPAIDEFGVLGWGVVVPEQTRV
jgi:hypothetical protein